MGKGGSRPWRELCYETPMHRTLSVLLCSLVVACAPDEAPRECQGDVEPYSLGPLSPCRVPGGPLDPDQQCIEGTLCVDGYCALSCSETNPCLDEGLCLSDPFGRRFCAYVCLESCPEWLGDFVECLNHCTAEELDSGYLGCSRCTVPDEVCE